MSKNSLIFILNKIFDYFSCCDRINFQLAENFEKFESTYKFKIIIQRFENQIFITYPTFF